MNIRCYIESCRARDAVRNRTIAELSATDWNDSPIVELDDPSIELPLERQLMLVLRILRRAVSEQAELILLLEDDLNFNKNLRYNIESWHPLEQFDRGQHFFGSLFNPGVTFHKVFPALAYGEASPQSVLGSQALLLSRATAQYMVTYWGVEAAAHADVKLRSLAARVCPLFFHVPSLIQHVGYRSSWGGPFRCATDFDGEWRSKGAEQRTNLSSLSKL
jgi:hypothetical protein